MSNKAPTTHGPGAQLPWPSVTLCLIATVGALLPVASHAQPDGGLTVGAQPAASTLQGLAPLSEVVVLEGPPTSVALLQSTVGARDPRQFAEPYEVRVNPTSHGRWETTSDGSTAVWRLRVRSTGAVSLNMGFSRYRMPPGGGLLIHRPDGREVLGPYTDADNKAHGELWTPVISGDEAVMEVVLPVSRIGELELELAVVNRGFRDLAPDRVVSPGHASCHIDVACSQGDPYRDQIRSVGLLSFDGRSSCSGVLLNNTANDGTPYLLTARHCFVTGIDAARLARSLVVYWNYQRSACGSGNPPRTRRNSQNGARILADDWPTDFILLRLDDPLDPNQDLFLAGWDRSEAVPSSAVSIHHPDTHHKSITLESEPLSATSYLSHSSPGDGFYLRMAQVNQGGFEGGSSGGPLFDENKRVVGQLRGGQGDCTNSAGHNAWFGRLAKSWTGYGNLRTRLSDWLDPAVTGATAIDGRNSNVGPVAWEGANDKALRLAGGTGALAIDARELLRDPDGDELTFSASSSDTSRVGVTVAGATVTLAPVAAGSATVTVTARDSGGSSENQSLTFEVTVGNNHSPAALRRLPPVVRQLRAVSGSIGLSGVFADADGDALTYSATSSNESAATVAVTPGQGGAGAGPTLTLTPLARGASTVTVTASDAAGSNTSATLRFQVEVASRPPVAVGTLAPMRLVGRYSSVSLEPKNAFVDPDGDTLFYTARSSSGAVVVDVAGPIVEVRSLRAGTATVTIEASDGSSLHASHSFEVSVLNGGPTVWAGPDTVSITGVGGSPEALDMRDWFQDPEEDPLTYEATSGDPVATVAISGTTLTVTPRKAGRKTIVVSARDAQGSNSLVTGEMLLQVNKEPELVVLPGALTLVEGATGSYTVRLGRSPSGPVIVTPSEVGSNKLLVSPPSVTLTPTTWRGRSVTVEASQDGDEVADAPILIRHAVSGIGSGSVSPPSVSVTVVEDDTPTLSVAAASVAESGGSLTFDVMLSAPSSSDVEVDYATSDVSGSAGAQAGSDYTATSGTLTFPAGSTSAREIRVPVTNDSEDEAEEERLSFTLGNARNAALAGGGSTLVVAGTIEDDDRPEVEVSFQSSTYAVPEGGTVTVVVLLSRDPEWDVEISLVQDRLGGAEEIDYSGVPWRLKFGSGVTRQEFLVAARTDPYEDEGEAVGLSFGSLPPQVKSGGATTISIVKTVGGGGSRRWRRRRWRWRRQSRRTSFRRRRGR